MENVDENSSLDFKWLKKSGVAINSKEAQYYESFLYYGVKYMLYDCVYMYNDGLYYIGKLTRIWELPNKTKEVEVHWFFRSEEIIEWLGETKTLKNEIFFATGEGLGVSNVNPLEAIIGQCNVVCISKDNRNPQPSAEQLQAADFIFYRTFDVQSHAICDEIGHQVGGLENKYVFNRKKSEKNENSSVFTSSETQKVLTKSVSLKHKDDSKGEPENKDIGGKRNINVTKSDKFNDRPLKKFKSDDKRCEPGVARDYEKRMDRPSLKPMVNKADNGVENIKRNKTLTGSTDILTCKKFKSDDKKPPEEKGVGLEVARDSERFKEIPSNSRSKHEDKLPADVNIMKTSEKYGPTGDRKNNTVSAKVVSDDLEGKTSKKTRDDKHEDKLPADVNIIKISEKYGPTGDRKNNTVSAKVVLDDLEGKTSKKTRDDGSSKVPYYSEGKKPPEEKRVGLEAARNSERFKEMPNSRSKHEDKLPTDVNYIKTSEKCGPTRDRKNNTVSAKVVSDDLEGNTSKKTRDDGSSKVPDKKTGIDTNVRDLGAPSKRISETYISLDIHGNKKAEEVQSVENRKELSLNKSREVSTDKDRNNRYKEFLVRPRPNDEKSSWFDESKLWENRLIKAYDKGTSILLRNIDPEYTSGDVKGLIWHAFKEECIVAKVLQHTSVSSPHFAQALVLLKSKEAAQRVLIKLEEQCLMLSNGSQIPMPLVATACPPVSTKESGFFGHVAIKKARYQNNHKDEAVSTSHFPQPNTIEYDMAMEWFRLQFASIKCWKNFHQQQGLELENLKNELKTYEDPHSCLPKKKRAYIV